MTPINWWNPLQLGQRCPVFLEVEKCIKHFKSHASNPLGRWWSFFSGSFFLEIHWKPVWNFGNLRNVGWCKVTCSKGYHWLKKTIVSKENVQLKFTTETHVWFTVLCAISNNSLVSQKYKFPSDFISICSSSFISFLFLASFSSGPNHYLHIG